MSILTFSDPTGSFECLAFSEALDMSSSVLEPGLPLILDVGGEAEAEGVRVRLIRAQALDHVALSEERHLVIHADNEECLDPVAGLLKSGGNGRVTFKVLSKDRSREFELSLSGKYQVTPELAGGVKSIFGVLDARLQ